MSPRSGSDRSFLFLDLVSASSTFMAMTIAPAGVCGSTGTRSGVPCTQPVNTSTGRCAAGHTPKNLPVAASGGHLSAMTAPPVDPFGSSRHAWLPPGRPEVGDETSCRRCGATVAVTEEGPWAHTFAGAEVDAGHRAAPRLCPGCGDVSYGDELCENCADRSAAGQQLGVAPYPDDIDKIPFAERAAASREPVWVNLDHVNTHWDSDDLLGCEIRIVVVEEDDRRYQEEEIAGAVTAIQYDNAEGVFTVAQPDGSTVDVDMNSGGDRWGQGSRSVSSRVLLAGEDARRQISDGRAGGYGYMARLADEGNVTSAV